MIAFKPNTAKAAQEAAARPVDSAEQWLGRNASGKRRLWERLNPRHRKQLQTLARALVLHQSHGLLPEESRQRLSALLGQFERMVGSLESLMDFVRQGNAPPNRSISERRTQSQTPPARSE